MAASRALSSPIVLDSVFSQECGYWEDEDLRACMLVNSLWFEYASSKRWEWARIEHLTKVESQRRQLYASKIYTIVPSRQTQDTSAQSICTNLKFPRLENLYGNINNQSSERSSGNITVSSVLDQYVPPRLQRLMLSGDDLDHAPLLDLRTKAPSLQWLFVSYKSTSNHDVVSSNFLKVIKGAGHIETIICGDDGLVTPQVLLHLAKRPNLKEWRCSANLRGHEYAECLQQMLVSQSFGALRLLQVTISAQLLPTLCRNVGSVETFRVAIIDTNNDWDSFDVIAGLAKLKTLSVLLSQAFVFCSSLKALQGLKKLESLALQEEEVEEGVPVALGQRNPEEPAVQHILGRFQNLTKLKLSVRSCPMTMPYQLLEWIREKIPNLESVDLGYIPVSLPPRGSLRGAATDSQLRDLSCYFIFTASDWRMKSPRKEDAREAVLVLLQMFPCLEVLVVRSEDGGRIEWEFNSREHWLAEYETGS